MPTFHLEMRNFPRALTRFNQSGQQLGAIILPWVQNKIIEMDGDKWAPWESTIAIVEGPPIPVDGLSMGRGWKTARRQGTDVTDRVLAEARQAIADGSASAEAPAEAGATPPLATGEAGSAATEPAQDYPSVADQQPVTAPGAPAGSPEYETARTGELAELLGAESERLLAAWRAVAARTGGLAPSESLALAERELQHQDRPEH
ncbi:MAG: hypothetical protein QOK19_148 [Solirubrobacteraceae bacterium]|jgi:hypothetical protein|nr:hypothetical protein [Solirubrobacteraceae bacterium]